MFHLRDMVDQPRAPQVVERNDSLDVLWRDNQWHLLLDWKNERKLVGLLGRAITNRITIS